MKRSWLKTLFMMALVCGLFFVTMEAVEACPGCSAAVAEDDQSNGADAGLGYTYSIFLMILVPYTIFMCFGIYFYRAFKKNLKAQEAAYSVAQGESVGQEKELVETS